MGLGTGRSHACRRIPGAERRRDHRQGPRQQDQTSPHDLWGAQHPHPDSSASFWRCARRPLPIETLVPATCCGAPRLPARRRGVPRPRRWTTSAGRRTLRRRRMSPSTRAWQFGPLVQPGRSCISWPRLAVHVPVAALFILVTAGHAQLQTAGSAPSPAAAGRSAGAAGRGHSLAVHGRRAHLLPLLPFSVASQCSPSSAASGRVLQPALRCCSTSRWSSSYGPSRPA